MTVSYRKVLFSDAINECPWKKKEKKGTQSDNFLSSWIPAFKISFLDYMNVTATGLISCIFSSGSIFQALQNVSGKKQRGI